MQQQLSNWARKQGLKVSTRSVSDGDEQALLVRFSTVTPAPTPTEAEIRPGLPCARQRRTMHLLLDNGVLLRGTLLDGRWQPSTDKTLLMTLVIHGHGPNAASPEVLIRFDIEAALAPGDTALEWPPGPIAIRPERITCWTVNVEDEQRLQQEWNRRAAAQKKRDEIPI